MFPLFQIIQHIANLLSDDTDIVNFASTCIFISEKLLPPHSSIWRRRFTDRYDVPQERSSAEIKIEYQIRAIVLSQKISFKRGEREAQTLWLEVVKTLLLESYSSPSPTNSTSFTSKNLNRIREVLTDSDSMNRPVSGYGRRSKRSPSDLFCAVQLVRRTDHFDNFFDLYSTIKLMNRASFFSSALPTYVWTFQCLTVAYEPTTISGAFTPTGAPPTSLLSQSLNWTWRRYYISATSGSSTSPIPMKRHSQLI